MDFYVDEISPEFWNPYTVPSKKFYATINTGISAAKLKSWQCGDGKYVSVSGANVLRHGFDQRVEILLRVASNFLSKRLMWKIARLIGVERIAESPRFGYDRSSIRINNEDNLSIYSVKHFRVYFHGCPDCYFSPGMRNYDAAPAISNFTLAEKEEIEADIKNFGGYQCHVEDELLAEFGFICTNTHKNEWQCRFGEIPN